MRSWSIPVGRLFGIEIRIHLTFVFLLVFVWGTEAAVQNASAALRGLALVGIVFGSVVLHELGHALVAQGSGIPATPSSTKRTPFPTRSTAGSATYESRLRDRW